MNITCAFNACVFCMICSLNASSSIDDWFIYHCTLFKLGDHSICYGCVCICGKQCDEIVIIFFFLSILFFFPFNVPVSICMWFRSNPTNADVLYLSDKKRFESSNFNKSNALIVYLHGFSERVPGGAGQSSQEIRDGMWRAKNEKKYLSEFSWNQHIH